ncbi:MAG: sulfotransferase [Opitutaceae bacterium]
MSRASHLEKILLCSSPRSGSTFAANLIQSSPEVVFLNEIMTRKRHLLPRFVRDQDSDDCALLRRSFEADLDQLLRYTLPYLRNLVHRNRWLKSSVFGLFKVASSVTSHLGMQGFERNPFYWFYFLNSLHEPLFKPFVEVQFPKSPHCSRLLIKDVHLLRSYRTYRFMYPDAKVIYMVRDPYAQVASQKKHHGQMDTGQRMERSGESERPPNEDQAQQIEHLRGIYGESDLLDRFYGRSFEETFALFWRLNNDALVECMRTESESRFLAIRYESLVEDTENQIRTILEFLNLPFSGNLTRYLNVLAAFRGEQRHGRSTFVSGEGKSEKWRSAFSESQVSSISRVLEGSPAMAHFGYLPRN